MTGPRACAICDPSVVDLDVGAVEPGPDGKLVQVYRACCQAKPARRTYPLAAGTGYRAATLGPGFATKGKASCHVPGRTMAGAVVVYDGPLPGGVGRLRITSTEPAARRLRDRMAQALLDAKLRYGTLAPAAAEVC